MTSYDFVIENGVLVTAGDIIQADLAIQGERIAAIGQDLPGKERLDARGGRVADAWSGSASRAPERESSWGQASARARQAGQFALAEAVLALLGQDGPAPP